MINKRFGMLLVLKEMADRVDHGITYLCRCDCGQEVVKEGRRLRKGEVKSCGCMKHLGRRYGKVTSLDGFKYSPSLAKDLYRSYKYNCDKTGRELVITLEEALKIFKLNCFYCGSPPSLRTHRKYYDYLHGMDRVNNKLGYTVENVVTCCTNCNLAKKDMTVSDFIDWAVQVATYSVPELERYTPEDFRIGTRSARPIRVFKP